jgi:hypothetical protein
MQFRLGYNDISPPIECPQMCGYEFVIHPKMKSFVSRFLRRLNKQERFALQRSPLRRTAGSWCLVFAFANCLAKTPSFRGEM